MCNWTQQKSPSDNSFNNIVFTDHNNGWIVGDNGTILHTNNGGFVGMNQYSKPSLQGISTKISPNPFVSSTNVSYTLSEPSAVTISIINPQGQLIDMIELEQPKGEQQVQWNAEGLPAGMYYFRIQAEDLYGSGKLILLR